MSTRQRDAVAAKDKVQYSEQAVNERRGNYDVIRTRTMNLRTRKIAAGGEGVDFVCVLLESLVNQCIHSTSSFMFCFF